MRAGASVETRFLAAALIDWIGTGFYLAVSAVYLTEAVGLTRAGAGVALAGAGLVAFAGNVPLGRAADRIGHRGGLVGLHVLRAVAFALLAFSPGVWIVVVALSALGLADQAAAGVTQALAGDVAGADQRVRLMARVRTVANLGITVGTLPAGLVLATGHDAFAILLAANAVSYLVAAAIVCTFRAGERAEATPGPRFLVPSRPTATLIAINGVLSLWNVMINVGLPLWVIQDTRAPRVMVAGLYATNTLLCVGLQIRLSRLVNSYRAAAVSQRRAALAMAASCACLAAAILGGQGLAIGVLVAGAALLTLGELLSTSAAWQMTYTLAPVTRSAEFFATYGLGRVGAQILGPLLITTVVLPLGAAGWLALAGLFAAAGIATPPIAARALRRPLSNDDASDHKPPTHAAANRLSVLPALALSGSRRETP